MSAARRHAHAITDVVAAAVKGVTSGLATVLVVGSCACMLVPSLTIPVVGGEFTLGTWQQIMLLEFDTRPREREIVIRVVTAG